MNPIEVRNYLQSYRVADRKVSRTEEQLREIQLKVTILKAVDYSRIVVDGNPQKDALEISIDRMAELKERFDKETKELYIIEDEIEAFILLLIEKNPNNNNDCSMLLDYYINKHNEIRYSLKDLVKKYKYSYEVVKNKFNRDYKKLAIIATAKNLKLVTKSYY